jgi:type VI secretion system protein VasG
MIQVNLKELIGKLNATVRRSLEGAAGLCLSRTNYNVEVEHWLLKALDSEQSDFAAILRFFEVDASRMIADLTRVVDGFKTGNSRPPALSPNIVDVVRSAWLIASIDFGESSISSGHMLCALMSDDGLGRIATGGSREFEKISYETLRSKFADIVRNSGETAERQSSAAGVGAEPREGGTPIGITKTPALDQYTIDLTARARAGQIDPVLGRDAEIRQMIDVLTRRRQNNPILTGEAGVGKTAVVEGFALRLAAGDVPPSLQGVSIRSLDMGLLQAGAGVKGEFENRLKSIIAEVKASATPVVLFIDEAHTLIGGGGGGAGDAANLLKPALARGELRTIAATTWAEYKKYFEKDAALSRRFQVVKVEEPTESIAIEMIRGVTDVLEKHHRVRILNEAIEDAVKLSSRYISGRQLPDKAVSLLDTTCARIGLSQTSSPPMIEDCKRRIEQLNVSIGILEREAQAGAAHEEQIEKLKQQCRHDEQSLETLTARWDQEKAIVAEIHQLHSQLDDGKTGQADADSKAGAAPADAERLRAELGEAKRRLAEIQGEQPLVHPSVNAQAIAETVSAWTGIPLGRMVANEIKTVLNLKELMEKAIIGQSHALDRIAQAIRTSRASLGNPRTPIGVFLLAGTSGVGKTETAITLAELLYGGEQNMTTINMSEFKEEHKVSLLMGSPPGYVGYGEGGVLTEAVRRKPYSVVLLDEMEKAHPGVQDVFYQVFDKGTMKDGEGRDIDFRNTVIIMTTNAGTDLIKSLCSDPSTSPEPDEFVSAVFPELLKAFKPAFLGRLAIIPYYPLSDEVMKTIIELKLRKVSERVADHYGAEFTYQPDLVTAIAARCTEVDTGARNVDHILTRTLLPQLSAEFLARMADGGAVRKAEIAVGSDGEFVYRVE